MDTHATRGIKRERPLTWLLLVGSIFSLSLLALNAVARPAFFQAPAPGVPVQTTKVIQQPIFKLPDQRMNILVMGVDNASAKDAVPGQTLTRSDTTILCTIDPGAKKAALVSIPRDSRVAIPGHGNGKLNSAHAMGGPQLAMKTVSSAFNVPVEHYVVVDTSALKRIFEMIGPLEVDVEQPMKYNDNSGKLHIDLRSGKQLLTPDQIEQYVRFRHTPEADIGRIRRQQGILLTAFKKVTEPSFVVTHLPQLITTFCQSVKTDLSTEDIGRLAFFGLSLHEGDISTASLPGTPATIRRVSYWIVNSTKASQIFDKLQCRRS